ncbi:MAG: glycosyltransferase family 2 protein [Elusimicrobiota bacterium]|jgi:glycosyltransferase involved in cell wall biosynthesis
MVSAASPYFSVIVPTYNRARMLCTALQTIQYQTCQDWECFVVDDGSTDETAAALLRFASDRRFQIISSDENHGMNPSRNLALEKARGRFITFLDSDDLWLPDRLQAFQRRAQASPESGFLFSNAYILRYGRIVGTLFHPDRDIPEGRVPGHYAIGDRRLPYVTTNVAIKREAFELWGKFRTDMRTLDTELFTRFLAQGLPVAAIKEPLSVRRLHDDQLTGHYSDNFSESLQAIAASGAPEADRLSLRHQIARETALYLIKAARPSQARTFLLEHLGPDARMTPEWRLSMIPAPILEALRRLRGIYMRLRYHPRLIPAAHRGVLHAISPLLDAETRPG